MRKASQSEIVGRESRLACADRLLSTLAVLALFAATATAQPKIAPNAGTGPYLPSLQPGLGAAFMLQKEQDRTSDEVYNALIDIRGLLVPELWIEAHPASRVSEQHSPSQDGPIEGTLMGLRERFRDLQRLSRSPGPIFDSKSLLACMELLRPLLDEPGQVTRERIDTARAGVDALIEVIGRDLSYVSRLAAMKLGVYVRRADSYGFSSFSYTPGERGIDTSAKSHTAMFYTASLLVPLKGSAAKSTGRFGVGLAWGDPSRTVCALGVASFLSPYAIDIEASVSNRIVVGKEKKRARLLLDHVRSGDLWIAGAARYISNSRSSDRIEAKMLEGALVYAFPEKSNTLGWTLSISGIYCAQHEFDVDEGGVELRKPVWGSGGLRPVYASLRYGTRNHWTFALESRF